MKRLPAVIVVAMIVALAAAALLSLGRHPTCTCGVVRLWSNDAWGPENSQQLFDPYSFTHISHGILLFLLFHRLRKRSLDPSRVWIATIAVESLWEVIENTNAVIDRYRATTLAVGYYGDTVLNSFGDIMACAVGAWIASRAPRAALVLMLALELALTISIRDSLGLNIWMLVYPLEAIQRWQAGH